MGLLQDLFGDPEKSTALGLLAAYGMAGRAPQGLLAASEHLAGADDRKLKRGLLEMQIKGHESEIAARAQATEKAKAIQDYITQNFGAGGLMAPQVSPGAFVPDAGGRGPVMPREMAHQAAPGSRLANLGIDQIVGLHAIGGPNLLEAYKWLKDPQKLESGSTYVDRNSGAREFIPRLPEGMAPQAGGVYGFVPGFEDSTVRLAGRTAGAQESAKADRDPVKVYNPDTKREEYMPRSQVVQPRPVQPQSIQSPQPAQAQPNVSGKFLGDPIQIMEQITRIPDPQERANAMAAFQEQSRRTPNFATRGFGPAAGPSSDEAAAAAGALSRAQTEGKGAGDRSNAVADKGVKADDMLSNLTHARMILEYGEPTGSAVGAGADKLGSMVGISTRGSQNAARLEGIAGWLTANVPRMEGPQSNYDVENYKIMAGRVGDRTMPIADRRAALSEIERIQKRYANPAAQSPGAPAGGPGGGWSIRKR